MLSNHFILILNRKNIDKRIFFWNQKVYKNVNGFMSVRRYSSKNFSLKNIKPRIKWDILYYPTLDERKYGKGANRWVFWRFLWYSLYKDSENWYKEGEFFLEIPLDVNYAEYDEDKEWDIFIATFAGVSGKYILFEPDYKREWDYNMNNVFVMDFIFDENFVIDALLFLLLLYFFLDKYVATLFLYFIYISYDSIIRSTRKLDEGKYGAETIMEESEMNYEFFPYTYTEYFIEKGKENDYLNVYCWNNRNVKKYFVNFYSKFGRNLEEENKKK